MLTGVPHGQPGPFVGVFLFATAGSRLFRKGARSETGGPARRCGAERAGRLRKNRRGLRRRGRAAQPSGDSRCRSAAVAALVPGSAATAGGGLWGVCKRGVVCGAGVPLRGGFSRHTGCGGPEIEAAGKAETARAARGVELRQVGDAGQAPAPWALAGCCDTGSCAVILSRACAVLVCCSVCSVYIDLRRIVLESPHSFRWKLLL